MKRRIARKIVKYFKEHRFEPHERVWARYTLEQYHRAMNRLYPPGDRMLTFLLGDYTLRLGTPEIEHE